MQAGEVSNRPDDIGKRNDSMGLPYKNASNIANQLSPGVWGRVPLRNCLALTDGCGWLKTDLNLPMSGTGVVDVLGGGDILIAGASATDKVTAAEFGTEIQLTAAGHIVLGGMNPSIDLGSRRNWACEISLANATAVNHGMFFGLASFADSGATVVTAGNVLHATTSALATQSSIVGFYKDEGAATVEAMMKKDEVVDGSQVVHKAAASTMGAGTFHKWGMCGDGSNLRYFVDGVQVGADLDLGDSDLPAESDLICVLAVTSSAASDFIIRYMAFAESN